MESNMGIVIRITAFLGTIVCLAQPVSAWPPPDVMDFFPDIEDDVSVVSWAHAVNSRALLRKALDGYAMMLEADVNSGHETGQSPSEVLPIMAHPPSVSSDISLNEWLFQVLESEARKGIKLDFKNISIVEESLKILRKYQQQISIPVWLNADVLPGPQNATTMPLPASDFLSLCINQFPKSVISIGWTTSLLPETSPTSGYTWDHVMAMENILRDNDARGLTITFPVRAAFVGISYQQLRWLLDVIPHSTLTVWSAEFDSVDISDLLYMRAKCDHRSIFYDLPASLNEEFKFLKNNRPHVLRHPRAEKLSPLNWVVDEGNCARPGSEAILFYRSCITIYMDKYQGTKEYPVTVKGLVEFLGDSVYPDDGIAIGLRNSPWVWVQVYANGSVTHPAEGYRKDVEALPPGRCFRFEIIDSGGKHPVEAQFWTIVCDSRRDVIPLGSPAKFKVTIPSNIDSTIQIAVSSVGRGMKVVQNFEIFVPSSANRVYAGLPGTIVIQYLGILSLLKLLRSFLTC